MYNAACRSGRSGYPKRSQKQVIDLPGDASREYTRFWVENQSGILSFSKDLIKKHRSDFKNQNTCSTKRKSPHSHKLPFQ
jgi:hypothetical protein